MTDTTSKQLSRIETRLVSGFRQLGVDPCQPESTSEIRFDYEQETVYVTDASVPLRRILDEAEEQGIDLFDWYISITNSHRFLGVDYDRRYNGRAATTGAGDTSNLNGGEGASS